MTPSRGRLTAILLLAFVPVLADAAQPPGRLFVLQSLRSDFNPAILERDYVDGMALQIGWSDVEPQEGRYDWQRVDQMLAQAQRRGKRATLHVLPLHPPQWLFDAGAGEFRFTMEMRDSPMRGREMREVLPWDPVYLDRWSKLTAELGRHYDHNDTVQAVSVTAPAPEMALVGGIPGTPAFEDLQRRYNKEVYLRAWTRMIDVYQSALPDKIKLLAPGIVLFDENFADAVVDYAHKQFGESLWLFNAGLRAGGVPQAGMGHGHINDILVQYARHGTLGLQTIWNASDDPNNRMRGSLREVLDSGLAMGASYFEVYAVDVLNPGLQTDLQQFRQRLPPVAVH